MKTETVYNFHKFYNINNDLAQASETNIETGDIQEFIDDLIEKSIENSSKRSFRFESEDVEVYSLLNGIFKDNFEESTIDNNNYKIAKRLAAKEKLTQDRY